MTKAIRMEISPQEIIAAVKRMPRREREAFIEDLLAATSPEYLESIREARADYRVGKVKGHSEIFGE